MNSDSINSTALENKYQLKKKKKLSWYTLLNYIFTVIKNQKSKFEDQNSKFKK